MRIFDASEHLIDGIGARVLPRELAELGVSDRDGEMCGVRCGEIDWGSIEGLVSPHGADDFLAVIAVIDEGGHHLRGEVVGADEKGVVAEG